MRANRSHRIVGLLLFLATSGSLWARAEPPAPLPRINAKTADLERREGLLPLWLDARQGKVWLELPAPTADGRIVQLLYVEGLTHGLGSNPVGLDRGQLGDTVLLDLRRVGSKILFEQVNLGYRALSDDAAERAAVSESFSTSVLWAAPIAARDADGATLIDLTSFLVRDAHGVARTLQRSGQGSYKLDTGRSAIDLRAIHVFPRNLEFEALLTYAGSEPGEHVREVTPQPEAVTLVQHHSLIALPPAGYYPRRFDPRAGSFAVRFLDYAVALDAPLERQWIVRHRLEKTTPGPAPSPVREPIVYYVESGTPQPIRQALIDGASWWAQAFAQAGFIDAFRVELLPADAHPLDARYNVIQWVHRSTRGWSYGGGVIDPRSGEMLKGHVSLGSLRIRQDRLLFEGLLGTEQTGTGRADDPLELALARIRQLAAHEVGHTLGLNHNFAASTYGRASVMDYPAPLVTLRAGELDSSEAYGVGLGAWDLHAIAYAYSEIAAADEAAQLDAIVQAGLAAGLLFLSDDDARPAGAAHPLANLWDNGADPLSGLESTLAVRAHALAQFGERSVKPGEPLALLQERLATVYLHHRYQLDAAVKLLGGVDYRYALRGDGQPPQRAVPAAEQRRALALLLSVLAPATLDIPDSTLALVLPRPPGQPRHRELFDGAADPIFDPLAAAAAAAQQLVDGLLQPQRCVRIVEQHRRDPEQPGVEELLSRLIEQAFAAAAETPRLAAIRQTVQRVVLDGLIELAQTSHGSTLVQAHAREALHALAARPPLDAHTRLMVSLAQRALDAPFPTVEIRQPAVPLPPGSPIGTRAARGCGWAQDRFAARGD